LTSEARIQSSIRIAGKPVTLEPHNCFACGTLNAGGLHLELHAGDDVCWTELALDKRFEGWDGIAHGGIICTILDEVMGWAVIEHDLWGVTARMAVEFKKPVVIGQPVRAEARVTAARRRVVDVEGELRHADGTLLAKATATYVAAPDAKKAELKARYGLAPTDEGVSR
jgi:uncharacterized protein (TIGR00369 family)